MASTIDYNAAATFQLPVTLPPRLDALEAAGQRRHSGAASELREEQQILPMQDEKKSPGELKDAFTQFVGETFYGQMIKAMRSTVGKPAYFHGGRGEEVFQGQLDQQLAQHLTKATAEKFAAPLFEQQFPHLGNRSQSGEFDQLSQLNRR